MTPAELEYADQRMRRKWHNLVKAEQQGASTQVLERMYNAYILSVEEYNRCAQESMQEPSEEEPEAEAVREEQVEKSPRSYPALPVPVEQKKAKKKAS